MPTRQELEFRLEDLKDKTKCTLCGRSLKLYTDKELHDCIDAIDDACRDAELGAI